MDFGVQQNKSSTLALALYHEPHRVTTMTTQRPAIIRSFTIIFALVIFTTTGTIHALQNTTKPRPASEILDEIHNLKIPPFNRQLDQSDPDYRATYLQEREQFRYQKINLIAELWHEYPDNDQLPSLLAERWNIMNTSLGKADTVLLETKKFLATHPLRATEVEAQYARAQAFLYASYSGDKDAANEVVPAADAFAENYPDDPRTPALLANIITSFITDRDEQLTRYDHLIQTYPDDRSAKYWKGKMRQINQLGQPFKLSFKDALTGADISTDQLQGKVIVIDFWATWCGPCIAEMPNMKKIYSQYHKKGVEFLGISLDDSPTRGGLDKLKKYCKENMITWPQYYQGNGWESEFSVSWGINSIPAMFIIDRKGNLHATDARGKLEQLIPQLLNEK